MADIADVDIRAITRQIFATVLGLDADEVDGAGVSHGDQVLVTGCVHLTGAWEGSVTVECAESLARTATAAMFLLDEADISEDDQRDVVGELANMTGGNVKSAIGGDIRLSLPSVTRGLNARISVPGTSVHEQVTFSCAGHRLVVTTLARTTATATAASGGTGQAMA